MQEAVSLIEQATILDEKFQRWFKCLPEEFHYKTERRTPKTPAGAPNTDDVWNGTMHIFESLSASTAVCKYCVFRIYAQEVIINSCKYLNPAPDDTAYFKAIYLQRQMADDVCASVPYHLNCTEDGTTSSPIELDRDAVAPIALGAYFSSWQLGAVLEVESLPPLQRAWVNRKLQFFADAFGYGNAAELRSTVF